jgi:hypothetical protein
MCADACDVYPDRGTAFDAVEEAVNELYGCIEDGVFAQPPATPYSFCWADPKTLQLRAFELAKSMASVKCKNKYPVGVIGAEARAHYTEARRIAAIAMEARQGRDAEVRPDPKDDSAGRNGIAQPPSGDS